MEAGDYQDAIRSYQQAMRITPQYSYLPYNLGLVYQRLNRRRDAETAYRRAMTLAPDSAEPLNALGSLKASEGKSAEAEKFYGTRCTKDPSLLTALAARHNLGLLLAGLKGRQNEAIAAWKQNLAANPDYLASRLSLAELLAQTGDTAGRNRAIRLCSRRKARIYRGANGAGGPVSKVESGRPGHRSNCAQPRNWTRKTPPSGNRSATPKNR